MFEGWSFLIAEMLGLLALALLAGFVAGWLVFGRRAALTEGMGSANQLDKCRAEVASLRVELEKSQRDFTPEVPAQVAKPTAPKKPRAMKSPRKKGADNLKAIKGIGPELEQLCFSLGFFHYDQIAKWSDAEIAWLDENLEGFKGRVTRDKWVAQAKDLAGV
ncbi:MAG: hypothetical protein AAF198_05050 [Pseudomonadota bacterium]